MVGSHLVCGVDDSFGAMRALRAAGDLAEQLGLQLSVVHVDPGLAREDPPLEAPAEDRTTLTVFGGEPAATLRQQTADPDTSLLVVGSRGRTSWHAALGSVSCELAATASVPVMVVPPTAASDGRELARAAAGRDTA